MRDRRPRQQSHLNVRDRRPRRQSQLNMRLASPAAVSAQRARSASLNTSSAYMQEIRMKQNLNLSINDSFYYTLLLKFLDYCLGSRFRLNYIIRIITLKTFS